MECDKLMNIKLKGKSGFCFKKSRTNNNYSLFCYTIFTFLTLNNFLTFRNYSKNIKYL